MESQKQLTLDQKYLQADEFDQELYLRPQLSADARAFLRLMYQAAHGQPPDGISGKEFVKNRETIYAMVGEQLLIADNVGVKRDIKLNSRRKAVRRIVEGLEGLRILKRKYVPDKDDSGKPIQRLYYLLNVVRLIDLTPVDLSTPIGRVVAFEMGQDDEWDDDFGTEESTPSGESSGTLSHGLSHGVSGGLSHSSKTPVLSCPAPESIKKLSIHPVHDQEVQDGGKYFFDFEFQEEGKKRAFDEMPDDSIRAIAGYSPNGQTFTEELRRTAFTEYFRDLVQVGFAKPHEAALFLAVIKATADRMSPSSLHKVRDGLSWLRTTWINRRKRLPSEAKKAFPWAKEFLSAAEVPA